MFRQTSTTLDPNVKHDGPITMKLGDNKLILKDNGVWAFESSELDQATFEIEKLVGEKDNLTSSLSTCLDQIDALQKEVVEVNSMKTVILEMVKLCICILSVVSVLLLDC